MTEHDFENVWSCKIGGKGGDLPPGADYPMRVAIERAFLEVTGHPAEFLFSGWGAPVSKVERAIINDEV